MEIHEFLTLWKVPKSEIRENLNKQKLAHVQQALKLEKIFNGQQGW